MPQMFIGSFNLRNLVHVFEADGPNCLVAWSASSLLDACCLFQKIRHRWSFRDEGEGSIGLNGDQGGNWDSRGDIGCTSVELFAKVHRPHAAGAESGAHGGCGCGLCCCDDKTLLTGEKKSYRRKRGTDDELWPCCRHWRGEHVRKSRGVPCDPILNYPVRWTTRLGLEFERTLTTQSLAMPFFLSV